jgi:hypothetical protein
MPTLSFPCSRIAATAYVTSVQITLFLYSVLMTLFTVVVHFLRMLKVILRDANQATRLTGQLRTGAISLLTGQLRLTMTLFVIWAFGFKSWKSRRPLCTLTFELMDAGTLDILMALLLHLAESRLFSKSAALLTISGIGIWIDPSVRSHRSGLITHFNTYLESSDCTKLPVPRWLLSVDSSTTNTGMAVTDRKTSRYLKPSGNRLVGASCASSQTLRNTL